jgi:Holliday junction resolvasome RuvABC endonuclease subunit
MQLIDRHKRTVKGLISEICKYHVRYAAIEDYAYGTFGKQPKIASKLCELGGQIKLELVRLNMTVFVVNTKYVKGWVGLASSKGNPVTKRMVVEAVNKIYKQNFKVKDNDMADACILAEIGDCCWLKLMGMELPKHITSVQRGYIEAILNGEDTVLNAPLLG